jgi:hypothetical protein
MWLSQKTKKVQKEKRSFSLTGVWELVEPDNAMHLPDNIDIISSSKIVAEQFCESAEIYLRAAQSIEP